MHPKPFLIAPGGPGLRSVPRYYMTGAGERGNVVVISMIINRLWLFLP